MLEREKTLALRRLIRHVTSGPIDLEKAFFLLARYHDPALHTQPFKAKLDVMASEIAARSRGLSDPLDRAHVLVAHLGRRLGYGGVAGDLPHTAKVHNHPRLRTKHGTPP